MENHAVRASQSASMSFALLTCMTLFPIWGAAQDIGTIKNSDGSTTTTVPDTSYGKFGIKSTTTDAKGRVIIEALSGDKYKNDDGRRRPLERMVLWYREDGTKTVGKFMWNLNNADIKSTYKTTDALGHTVEESKSSLDGKTGQWKNEKLNPKTGLFEPEDPAKAEEWRTRVFDPHSRGSETKRPAKTDKRPKAESPNKGEPAKKEEGKKKEPAPIPTPPQATPAQKKEGEKKEETPAKEKPAAEEEEEERQEIGKKEGPSKNGIPVTQGKDAKAVITGNPGKAQLYTDPKKFKAAIQHLGTSTIIDFDDVAALPGDTYLGRARFIGEHYQSRGLRFASPHGHALFIAPGGSSWNASNSLSVGRLPFDPNPDPVLNDDDALEVTLKPSCIAVGFTMVDLDVRSADESIRFFDAQGVIVGESPLPPNFQGNRAFIGIVSRSQPIARIVVNEKANDGDDLDYDDFILVRPLDAPAKTLGGDWTYLDSGVAKITQTGKTVTMLLRWTPRSEPGWHYEVQATMSGQKLTGEWRYAPGLKDTSSAATTENKTAFSFSAEVSPDHNTITVANTDDPNHDNWNRVVFTRTSKTKESSSTPQDFHACFTNSGSVASAGPCMLAPNAPLSVHMSKTVPNPPAKLMFKAALAHGVPASVTSPLSGTGKDYSTPVPAALCGAGTGGKWEIFLLDSTGKLWGNIGQLSVDCRAFQQ